MVRIYHYENVTSTMDVAAGLAREECEHLSAVLADEQTAGRGRQGKVWRTYAGHSLAATVVLRGVPTEHLALLTSVTLRGVLARHTAAQVEIKWPNDLLLAGEKVAGILVEVLGDIALVGFGVNLTCPEGAEGEVIGAFLEGGVGARALLEEFLACYDKDLGVYGAKGWSVFNEDYTQHCVTLGQMVRWRRTQTEFNEIVGHARGIDVNGALELVDARGALHRLTGGMIVAQGLTHGLGDDAAVDALKT